MRLNRPFWLPVAAAALGVAAGLLIAAELHGRRRARRAWLIERSTP